MQTNITEEQIKADGGIIYDPGKWGDDGKSKDEFINASHISDKVIEIYTYMLDDQTVELRSQMSEEDFSTHMEKIFQSFADNYYALFKKIISGEDITPLLKMLSEIHKCNQGEMSYEQAEKSVGHNLRGKYLPHLQNGNNNSQKGMRQYKQLDKKKRKK